MLIFVHLATTLYEQYEQRKKSKPQAKIQVEPTKPAQQDYKRQKVIEMQKQIELKFQKSSMNKTYAFPRKTL